MGIRVTRDNLVPLLSLGPYFAFGLLSICAATLLVYLAAERIEAGFYRHPLILGAVHATILGWGVSIALGSLQQMVPVVFGSQLYSLKLARWGAYGYVVGVILLVWGLGTLRFRLLVPGALLVPAAVLCALVNIWRSGNPPEVEAAKRIRPFVLGALVYLGTTVLIGTALAINLTTNWLGSAWQGAFAGHTTAGLVGWFSMLVMGISYHLLPFFGLTPKKTTPAFDRVVLVLLHIGVWTLWLGTAFQGTMLLLLARLVLAGAAILFLWDTRSLFNKRPQSKMHPTVTYVRIAHLYAGAVALGFLAFGWMEPAASTVWLGLAGLFGWLTNTIFGYLHRILPFFVWHNKYWGRTDEPGVPAFRGMVNEGVAWLGLAVYNAGVVGLLLAIPFGLSVKAYAALLVAGVVLAAGNLVRTLLR